MRVLRFQSLPVLAWKNGRGRTREIASYPAGAGIDDFDWRISIADVAASGPFSSFPGIQRCILLCQGSSMSLTVDGIARELTRFEPFWFAGEADTTCVIGSEPTRDLNVMLRRGRCSGEVTVIAGPAAVAASEVSFLVAVTDTAVLDSSGSVIASLAPLDTLQLTGPIRVPEHAVAIAVNIRS